MKKRGRFVVSGRVQGVCYRMYACEEAERLGLAGWVRNLPDGTVEVMVEGDETKVQDFLRWCRTGPPYALVTGIAEEYSRPTSEFDSFTVAY